MLSNISSLKSTCSEKRQTTRFVHKVSSVNPSTDMPISGSSNSEANEDMM